MKKLTLFLIVLFVYTIHLYSQVTIADWESGSEPLLSGDRAGLNPERVENPHQEGLNNSYFVQRLTTVSDYNYEVVYTNPKLNSYIDFTNVNAISVKVWSEVAGKVVLKISRFNDHDTHLIAEGDYSDAEQWQVMNFHLPEAQNDLYDIIAIFPDYEGGARSNIWYIDDIRTIHIGEPSTSDTIVNFDTYADPQFEDWLSTNGYGVTGNPKKEGINSSDSALYVLTSERTDEGVKINYDFNFENKNSISINVLSDTIGVVELRLEYPEDTISFPSQYQYTNKGHWQNLVFDLGNADLDSQEYNLLAIRPDFGGTVVNKLWYFDDFVVDSVQILPFASDTIANFDEKTRIFFQWDSIGLDVVEDPKNTTNHVLKVFTRSDCKYEGFKTTLERNLNFSKTKKTSVKVNVLSASTGMLTMNIEGNGVDQHTYSAMYTNANQWQVLTFDVSSLETNAYNLIAFLPDAGNTTDGVNWYFDDIEIGRYYDFNTYSDWDNVTRIFEPVGSTSVTAPTFNPLPTSEINPSENVMKITVTQDNDGVITDLGQYIDFNMSAIFPLKIYSENTGDIKLQLSGTNVATKELTLPYTTVNEWQQLLFDFGRDIQTDVYDKISVLTDAGTWYIDDLTGPGLLSTPVTLNTLYSDWDSISMDTSGTWGETICILNVDNPVKTGINQSTKVIQVSTSPYPDTTYEGCSFDIPGVFNFESGQSFAINVYSAMAGKVLFKIENTYIDKLESQIEAYYTKQGTWQQLVFTFDSSLSNLFNRMAIFPDFEGDTTLVNWYFDDIQGPGYIDKALINKNVGGIPEGMENGKIITTYVMGETLETSVSNEDISVEGLPAEVSVGSVSRVNDMRLDITLANNSSGNSLYDIPLTITVSKDAFVNGTQDLSAGGVYITGTGEFTENREKKVFAHFLPWFNTDIITDSVPAYCGWRNIDDNPPDPSDSIYSNKPLIGEYSLLDEDVVEYQLLSMYAAGFDGMIIDVDPSSNRQLVLTRSVLNKLKEMNQKYDNLGFNLEFIIAYDEKNLNANVYEGMKCIRDLFTHNPDFSSFRFNDDKTGYPLIMTWAVFDVPLFDKSLDSLYNDSVIHIAQGDGNFMSSDANFQWINYLDHDNSPLGNTDYWGENYFNNYEYVLSRQDSIGIPVNDRNYVYMGTVWPGFDDHKVPDFWNNGYTKWMSRNVTAGETMTLTFDRQMSYSTRRDSGYIGSVKVEMPWIQVATWNDWSEGTSIEPSTGEYYGYSSLNTTTVKIAEFKDTETPDTSRLKIPYAIYQARKSNNTAGALCMIDQLLSGNSYSEAVNACGSGFCKYIPMPSYSPESNDEYSGASCIKMILDLEDTNSYTPSEIYEIAKSMNHSTNATQEFVDPDGIYKTLNYYGLSGYNYAEVTELSKLDAEKDMCYWISNTIPNVDNPNMPSVVPIGGNYNHWVVVNGFRSDINPHDVGIHGNFVIYGFYLKDPNIVNGIGQDIYVQSSVFDSSYFKPIVSSDIWNGTFVTINEPPVNNVTAKIQPVQPSASKPVTNNLRFLAAEEGLMNYQLINNDENVMNAMKGAKRGQIFFVDLSGAVNDYYIVTFEKDGGCVLAVTIDANNGALKEVSFAGNPDGDYYNNLKKNNAGFKSLKESSYLNNAFYPVMANVVTMNETQNTESFTDFDFNLTPNPANDYVNIIINSSLQGSVEIDIYGITGTLVDNIGLPGYDGHVAYPFSVQHYEKGIYIIRVKLNGESIFKKLIIE